LHLLIGYAYTCIANLIQGPAYLGINEVRYVYLLDVMTLNEITSPALIDAKQDCICTKVYAKQDCINLRLLLHINAFDNVKSITMKGYSVITMKGYSVKSQR